MLDSLSEVIADLVNRGHPVWLAVFGGLGYLLIRLVGKILAQLAQTIGTRFGGLWVRWDKLLEAQDQIIAALRRDAKAREEQNATLRRQLENLEARIALRDAQIEAMHQQLQSRRK